MSEKKEIVKPTEYEEIVLMERKDEEQILEELKGHYLEEFVYSFDYGGRRVTGLSWVGVKECAYRMGGIDVQSCIVEDKGDYWMVTVKAMDRATGSSRFGAATQSKKMKMKDGSEQEDMFALPKALSKAQRNAIRALIPEAFIKTFIDRFLEERKGKIVDVTPTKIEAPAPKPVPTTNKLITWTVKGEDFPIPVEGEQARPYIGLVRNKIMKGFTEKYSIVFEEEIAGGYIVSIKSSSIPEDKWNEFHDGLNWALRIMAGCKKEDVRIEVESATP